MDILRDYQLLLIPLISLIITQAIKTVIDLYYKRPGSMNSYGGMPSSHSALFAALVVVVGLVEGWQSFPFAISAIMYLVVVRDAAGIRQHLGRHGQLLKDLIMEHAKDHNHQIPHEAIITRLGHTPAQVVVGTICGVVLALAQYALLNY